MRYQHPIKPIVMALTFLLGLFMFGCDDEGSDVEDSNDNVSEDGDDDDDDANSGKIDNNKNQNDGDDDDDAMNEVDTGEETCDPECGANETCIPNEKGAMTCACVTGFMEKDGKCVEATCDPACGKNASCQKEGGLPICVCDDGYVGDGSTCTSEDSCADANYWDITYTLPKSVENPGKAPANPPANQNALTLRDTMLQMGDANRNIGTGEVTIRFENVDGKPGGKAYLLKYKMPMDFTVSPATTNIVGSTGHEYKDGPCGSSAVGNVKNGKLVWSEFDGEAQGEGKPNIHAYFTDGSITCKGALCGQFGAPPQGTTPQSRGPFDLHFEPWELTDGVSSFFMPVSITEKDKNSTTRVQLYGIQSAKECKTIEACE